MRLPIGLKPGLGLALLRVVVGITFALHGWQKFDQGIQGVAGFFGSLGIPAPEIMAPLIAGLELIGGIALILGLGTRIVALLLAGDMLVALVTFHLDKGFFVSNGGYELVLLLAAGCLALFLAGPGDYALDDMVAKRGRRR